MSDEHTSGEVAPSSWALTPHGRKVLRYAVGATLAASLALGIGWPLSFLAVILSLGFLAAPAPLSFVGGINLIATVALACLITLVLSHYFIPFPLVYVPLMGLILFRLFYAKAGGASPLLITWLMILGMALPLLALVHQAVPVAVAGGVLTSVIVLVLVVWFTWVLIPNPPGESAPAGATHGHGSLPQTDSERLRGAVSSTAVVLLAVVVFYTLQWTGGILVIIFICLLSAQPSFAGNLKAGIALLVGNTIGGLAAMAYFELLVMVPLFPFMLLLALFLGLVFGGQLFSGKKFGPLFGMAYSTAMLVVVSSTAGTGDADVKAPMRVFQLFLATSYVVLAFAVIEQFWPRRKVT